jgi:hypothetical protein
MLDNLVILDKFVSYLLIKITVMNKDLLLSKLWEQYKYNPI